MTVPTDVQDQASGGDPATAPTRRLGTRTREALLGYAYLLPAFVVFGAFFFYPLGKLVQLSLFDTRGVFANQRQEFVGFSQWADVLGGEEFHEALAGFGMLLNASYTESSIDPDGPGGSDSDTIPGLSTVVANATLYYENHGFAARVSQRFRDPYRGEYSYIFGQRSYRYTLNERQVDLQLSYDFQETSALAGLTLMFQVNNLNNEPFRTEVSDSNGMGLFFPEEFTEYGRQFLVGFRYAL